jgi:protoporphyrinogen oxidase
MILPNNLDNSIKINYTHDHNNNHNNDEVSGTKTTLNLEVVDTTTIKKETYYKMKFILNSLDKNWAIKKRNNVFYLKNLDNSTKEIITEDYLNKRVIQKIYGFDSASVSMSSISSKDILNKDKSNIESYDINKKQEIKNRKKEDIIPLKQGILALKERIDNGKMDANKELKNEIYVMIFLMNTLDNGWSVRKKNNNFVFRKKHNDKKEIYSDNYLVNFLKSNIHNII